MEIDSAFPGGNIFIEGIEGSDVFLRQDLRDTAIDWFYWCFRVRGAEGRSLRFVVTASPALGVRGPALSLDAGASWAWLGRGVVEGNSFRYTFPVDQHEVRLSFAMPYQESHWNRFMAKVGPRPEARLHRLCLSEQGRPVDCLFLGESTTLPIHRVAVTARHHSCEMMANYVVEVLVQCILDDPEAAWIRENTEFMIVPFVDLDGVENGDQGKARRPRDHGRDYEGDSIFAPTRAIRQQVAQWSQGCLRVGLDLHCPHIKGPVNEVLYLVGSSHARIASQQQRFSEVMEAVSQGPLPFSASDFLPFGQSWNTAANYTGGKGFSKWVSEIPDVTLGTGIEIPYANARGIEVNQESARSFGLDLGRGLDAYLRST